MLAKIKLLFGSITAILALYGIITDDTLILALMFLFLGLTFLMIGITEKKRERRNIAILTILLAWFNRLGSFYILLFKIC